MSALRVYPRTPPGAVEVKRLPARVAVEARAPERSYFDAQKGLFRRLFGYLRGHRLKMTTPVESAFEPAAMRFLVEPSAADGLLDEADVRVLHEPEALVVSAGVRGRYTTSRFEEGRRRIDAWFAAHPDAEPAGPPEVAYWDGPMRPSFLRRSEVHVPLRGRDLT